MGEIKIITNNVPRDVIHGFELSAQERGQFDYLDWNAIDDGRESASFFRYKGELYDMGEFSAGLPEHLQQWDGYQSDSFFSALVIRYADKECETVVIGRVLS